MNPSQTIQPPPQPFPHSPLFAAFETLGRELFVKVAGHVADGECDEWCEEVMDLAVKHGLARREEWNAQDHPHIEGSPGDLIWTWRHLPDGWKEGKPAWEFTTMDGQRIQSDPTKRGYLHIYNRGRFAAAVQNLQDPLWRAPNEAPRDELILADFGWPWPVPATWDASSGSWAVVSLQRMAGEGDGPGEAWFETEHEKTESRRRWCRMPALPGDGEGEPRRREG
jgi:hypothetical protein